jgi:hypothetical protein
VTAFRFVHVGKHGGMVSPEIQSWADSIIEAFPAAIDEIFFIREKPISPSPRGQGIGNRKARGQRKT